MKLHGSLLANLLRDSTPLDMRIVGRTLLHAAAVGVAAGLAGAAFFVALEYFSTLLLEVLAGYTPLRADGETFAASEHVRQFRPWLLAILPALGGLACGLLARSAPEVRGGGGDATIAAFHQGKPMATRRLDRGLAAGGVGDGDGEGPGRIVDAGLRG